jgi:hypothetical protein
MGYPYVMSQKSAVEPLLNRKNHLCGEHLNLMPMG